MSEPTPDRSEPDGLDADVANLVELAKRLRDALRQKSQKLVLAESCTAGRVAATLSLLPGISQWLCGSFVVYRNASKTAWLDVPASLLDDPQLGPVSPETTRLLAASALRHTPEASVAIAVTGDVGPGAAAATDGIVFVAGTARTHAQSLCLIQAEKRIRLMSIAPRDTEDIQARLARLDETTRQVLSFAIETIGLIP